MRNLVEKARRYVLPAVGPFGAAGAQFVLSIQLLHALQPLEFGVFALLLVIFQLTNGVWGALFLSPMPVLVNAHQDNREHQLRILFSANLVATAIALCAFGAVGWFAGAPVSVSTLYATFGAAALLRSFARAHAYVMQKPISVVSSDSLYTAVLICSILAIWISGTASLELVFASFCISSVIGLLPFGREYFLHQFVKSSPQQALQYAFVWRKYSGWSFVGVLTTEATGNAHAYIVSGISGPAAFAPLAASALVIRPIAVAMNALSDFERPQLARELRAAQPETLHRSLTNFRLVLVGVWLAAAVVAGLIVFGVPSVLFPARYDFTELLTGAILWMSVALIRSLRMPDSLLLQARGEFQPLAYTSILSAIVSIASVTALLVSFGPLWSLLGVLAGEIIFAASVWHLARREGAQLP